MFRITGRRQSRSPLGGAALLPAVVGLAVGFFTALGWRFTAPRVYVDADPPIANGSPASTAYFQVFDYLQYVGGPTWLPSVVVLPMLGVALGTLIGAVTRVVPGRRRAVLAAAAAITGLLTGLGGALYAGQWTPQLTVTAVSDPMYADAPPPPDTSFDDTVVGAPPRWDVGPPTVSFPTAGAVFGSVCGALLLALNRRPESTP